MSPRAEIAGKSYDFASILVNPQGGPKDSNNATAIFAKGGTDEARTALVDGADNLTSITRLPGEPEEALRLNGEPVLQISRKAIRPKGAVVHLS